MSDTPFFVFLTCQPGAEKWAKEDIAARHPEWRFAFSRPGFLTFKTPHKLGLDLAQPTIFARQWGVCLGWTSTLSEGLEMGHEHLDPQVIHVFSRDAIAHREEGALTQASDLILAQTIGVENAPASGSDRVLDLVVVDAGRVAVCAHQHGSRRRPSAGGRPPDWAAPEGAPSRVWGKVMEAMWRTGITPGTHDHVLDIGCAPGGGTIVLLENKASVTGIDPAAMAPQILGAPGFTHIRKAFERVSPAELPKDLTGFVYDVNLTPRLMLPALQRLLAESKTLQWGFVTLKLNRQGALDEIPWMLERLLTILPHAHVEQLYFNRQEVFCALTRKPL